MNRFVSLIIPILGVFNLILLGGKLVTDSIVRRAEHRYPPQGQFITVEGHKLHYVSRGDGQPGVLLHGDGGSVYDWILSVFERLGEEYRVIAFDRPGFGYSQKEGQGTPVMKQIRLLHAALVELGVEIQVLVGHSRGGNLALAYGLTYPEDLQGIVTVAAAPYGGKIAFHNRLLAVPGLGAFLAHTVYVPFGRGAVESGLAAAFSPQKATEEYVNAYAAYELRPGQLLAHAYDQVEGQPVTWAMTGQYHRLDVPLVILHGTHDQNVPIGQARKLNDEVPRIWFLDIPEAGHELMFTHPEVVKGAVDWAASAQDG